MNDEQLSLWANPQPLFVVGVCGCSAVWVLDLNRTWQSACHSCGRVPQPQLVDGEPVLL